MNQFLLTPFALDARDATMDRLARPDWIVHWPTLEGDTAMGRIGSVQRGLVDLVERTVTNGRRPVSIGGDCCQSIAVLAGLRRAGIDPAVVWLDAHGDFNTWDTSPSGFIAGMSLAMLVGRGELTLLDRLGLPPLAERDIVLSDARDLDPGERASLQSSAVTHITRVDDLIAHLPANKPLYVHFDVDIIDADEAPAMLYPVKGGPSIAAMTEVARRLHETDRLAAVSLTVWALDRDQNRRTEHACMSVLDALIA